MLLNAKNSFIDAYNNKLVSISQKWRCIPLEHHGRDKRLNLVLNKIGSFIQENNLDSKKLVCSISDHYLEKNKRFPNIFFFYDCSALTIYNNYTKADKLDLSETQKILVLVKKSKKVSKILTKKGIITYRDAIQITKDSGKADPYFLIAHGFDDVSEECKTKWKSDESLQLQVLDIILND